METVAIVASIASAVGSVREGYQRQAAYQQQAAMTRIQTEAQRLESERRAIQYEQQGTAILRRINVANAAVAARASAGGVMPFEGSAALVATMSEKAGGREYGYATEGAGATRRMGLVAAKLGELKVDQYTQAADTAVESGWMSAAGKLGMAAFQYGKLGGQKPADVEDRFVQPNLM
jgi:cell division protein FtsL